MAGSVYRRGKTWSYTVDLPKVDGKRKQQTVGGFATRELAEVALARRVVELHQGVGTRPYGGTVADFCERWLAGLQGVTGGTKHRYATAVRLYIAPHLGHLQVGKLSPHDLHQWHGLLRAHGLSGVTISHAHAILAIALGQGVRYGELARNVAELVRPPRSARAEVRYWTREEVRAFVACHVDNPGALLYLLLLGTGLRPGEATALRWADIDLRGRSLTVGGTMTFDEAGRYAPVHGRGKSKHAGRVVSVSESLVRMLRAEHDRARLRGETGGLVFRGARGGTLYSSVVNARLRELCVVAGVRVVNAHGLRHTHATMLIASGVDPKTISARLGHASVAFTLDVYGHVWEEMAEAAAEAAESLLWGGGEHVVSKA